MERRKRKPEESWLLSYADLVTNLLLFFVLLMSAANISKSRFQQIVKSVSGMETPQSLASIQKEIDKRIEQEKLQNVLHTSLSDEGLEVYVSSGVIFDSGRADILPQWENTLTAMLETLEPYSKRYLFAVEGHTDPTPVTETSAFHSNWDLSAARAIEVSQLLQKVGIPPQRMRVEGYADTKPLPENELTNLTQEERLARHRRVIVRVY